MREEICQLRIWFNNFFAVFWSTLNLFAIFSCIDLFAISPISPTSSPTSYHPCKVGVVSSGSGATGHCAGANRPGKSLSEVCGLLCAFKTRFQLILPVHSQKPLIFKVAIEW